MQMNHRIPINSHHELKKAEAFEHLENVLIVLQKKNPFNSDPWAFLYVYIYYGRDLSWGTSLALNCFEIRTPGTAVV